MMTALLLCVGMVSAEAPPVTPADRAAYEAARASAGRSPDAHIKLALWCDAHGLRAERAKHLALAVLADPRQATARGLLGLVAYRGQWQRPDAVAAKVGADPDLTKALAEYNARRAKMADTAKAHWELALWCEQAGLAAEAKAHLGMVVRIDPSHERAWKHLGYKKVAGRWTTDAELAAEHAQADAQKKANRHWQPLLAKWRGWLADESKRREAGQRLAAVTDPRAVQPIMLTFGAGDGEHQATAARLLGQIDAAEASRALAWLALAGRSAEARRIATETLRRRDAREYAGPLVALMRPKVKYEVRRVAGPGTTGEIFIEGERVNVRRRYSAPPTPSLKPSNGDFYTFDAYGLPVIVRGAGPSGFLAPNGSYCFYGPTGFAMGMPGVFSVGTNPFAPPSHAHGAGGLQNIGFNPALVATQAMIRGFSATANPAGGTIFIGQAILATQQAAATAEAQLEADTAALDRYNADAEALNNKVGRVLNDTSGQNLPAEPRSWQTWFVDQMGYSQKFSDEEKPTVVQEISPQLPPIAGFDDNANGYLRTISCFGAGTLVRTQSGPRPIETLHVGDQVLTQSTRTGALGYQPIAVVHHNPPSPTFEIALGSETIVSSHFHRFWKVGRGWVMARELHPGDTVRTLGGLAKVESIRDGRVQPVFNLDVAEDHDFFAGTLGALVHDNTLPDLRLAPFDAPPSLATASAPSE